LRTHLGARALQTAAIHTRQIAEKPRGAFQRLKRSLNAQIIRRGIAPGFNIGAVLREEIEERGADALGIAFRRLWLKMRLAGAIERAGNAARQHVLAKIPSHARALRG